MRLGVTIIEKLAFIFINGSDMPVIRISQQTWERLKTHATPLEHTANDVVNIALDALETAQRKGLQIRPRTTAASKTQPDRSKHRKRLSLKHFRMPLLKTLYALGGSEYSREIRATMERLVAPMLGAGDYEIVSNGQPRWWNAICSVRNDLIREGLFRSDSERGIWELSKRGTDFMSPRADDRAKKRRAGRSGFRKRLGRTQ